MKKILFLLAALPCLWAHGQPLHWVDATPHGILENAEANAWHSGRSMDMLDYQDGSVLLGTETGGVWWTDPNGVAQCLTNNWDDPDINAIERGPYGEHHVYISTNAGLYEARGPKLDGLMPIPLPPRTMFVKDIAIANGARKIILGCDNGVFWSEIPLPHMTRDYTWTLATGIAPANVYSLSARSTGAAWGAVENPTPSLVSNQKLAIVNRTPIHRDLFWIGTDGAVMSAWNELGRDWGGNTFAVTGPGSAAPNSEIAAVARHSEQLDVFYMGPGGEIRTAWWNPAQGRWNSAVIYPAANGRTGSGLAAVSRTRSTLDIFWVTNSGEVQHGSWSEAQGWIAPVRVASGESVSLGTSITAVARTPESIQLFWVGRAGNLQTNYWQQGSTFNWGYLLSIPGTGAVATGAGIGAVARDASRLDISWVSTDGRLMTTWWREGLTENWTGHAYALTAPGTVDATSRIALCSRHPLQLDLFWKGTDGNIHTNWWYQYSPQNFSQQSYSLGRFTEGTVANVFATTAFDDELSVYALTPTGKLHCKRWTTDNCDLLVGYLGDMLRRLRMYNPVGAFSIATFVGNNLVMRAPNLTGGDGRYSTTTVAMSKYGTAAYASIACPNDPDITDSQSEFLRLVYKTTNLNGTWVQTSYNASGDPNCSGCTLKRAVKGQGLFRNNALAVSPVDDNLVYIGHVNLYKTTNGGSNWNFVGSPHLHSDQSKVIFGTYDKTGKTVYFCSDGGVASTKDAGANHWSLYNRQLATVQCYSQIAVRQFGGNMAATSRIEGLIGTGVQDNGNLITMLNEPSWRKVTGGDGGFFSFLSRGQVVTRLNGNPPNAHMLYAPRDEADAFVRGLDPMAAFRILVTGGVGSLRVIPVADGPNGQTQLENGGFSPVQRVQPNLGTLNAAVEGVAWQGNNLFSLWNATGFRDWRFRHNAALPAPAPGGPGMPAPAPPNITNAVSINGDLIVVGSEPVKMFEYDRIAQTLTEKPVDWTDDLLPRADYHVSNIAMLSYDVGYAVFSHRDIRTGPDASYLFRYFHGHWTRVPLTSGGVPFVPNRIYGLTADFGATDPVITFVTDDKVYLSTNAGEDWQDRSDDLPTRAHLADVQIVRWPTLGRKLLVSTYGRGIWMASLP